MLCSAISRKRDERRGATKWRTFHEDSNLHERTNERTSTVVCRKREGNTKRQIEEGRSRGGGGQIYSPENQFSAARRRWYHRRSFVKRRFFLMKISYFSLSPILASSSLRGGGLVSPLSPLSAHLREGQQLATLPKTQKVTHK